MPQAVGAIARGLAKIGPFLAKGGKGAAELSKGLVSAANSAAKFGANVTSAGSSLLDLISYASTLSNKWLELQDISFKTARSMGLSRQEAMKMDRQLMQNVKEFGRAYGTSAQQIADYQKQYSEATGRNIQLTKQQMEQMIALGNITDNATASKLVEEFDTLGVNVEDTLAYTGQLQERAKFLGLNATKASQTLAENIKLAASHSFKNGVEDIEKMALKSQSLKMNMDSIMTAADKFNTIQGAIETSANIQMLGGSFASQFSNPMGAMYEAMADPAAFQDRLIKTIAGKGTYDKKTNQVHFDPVTMAQMQEMSKQLGVSVEELTKPAMAMAQNAAVDKELRGNWSAEDKAAIENLSRSNFDEKTGKHYVNIQDENGDVQQVNVEDLTQEQLKQAQDSAMTQDKMWSDVHAIKETIVNGTMGRARQNRSGLENLKGYGESVKGWAGQIENIVMPAVSGLLNGGNGLFGNLFSWIGKLPGLGGNSMGSGSISGPDTGTNHFAEGGIVEPIQHAAEGAVVGGDSYYGDNVPIMANSGEIVLNKEQQSGLMSLLTSVGKLGLTTIGGNLIGKKLGLGNLGTKGLAVSALGGGDLMSSMIQMAVAKKMGPMGAMMAGMDPISAMMFGGGGKGIFSQMPNPEEIKEMFNSANGGKNESGAGSSSIWDYFGIDAKKDSAGRWRNSKGQFTKSPMKQLMPKTTENFKKFNESLRKTGSKIKSLGSKFGGFKGKLGKLGGVFGKLGSKIGSKLGFVTNAFGRFGNILKPVTNSIGRFGAKIGGKLSGFGKLAMGKGRSLVSNGMLKAGELKDLLSKYGSKGFEFLKNSKLGKFGGKTLGKIKGIGSSIKGFGSGLASDASGLITRGKAIARLNRIKGLSKATESLGAVSKSSKLLSGASKFFKSGGGKLLGGIGKKLPGLGALLSVGTGVADFMSATSDYNAREEEIKNSNLSEDEKKRALEENTDEKRGAQGKAVGGAVGGAAGAAIGGALGTLIPIPVLGTAIGTAVGGFLGEKVGGAIGSLAKPLNKMVRGVGNFLFGDDSKSKASFSDEELSDPQLSAKADAATIKIYELMLKKENGGVVGKAANAIGDIATAPLKLATGVLGGIGSAIGGLIGIPKSPEVSSLPVVGQHQKINEGKSSNSNYGPANIGPQDINLNVSGTIKLDLGGKQTGIDAKKLLDSPQFKAQLTDIISRRLNDMGNGGKYNKEGRAVNTQKMFNGIK